MRPPVPPTRLQWRKADIAIGKAGVQATERSGAATVVLDEHVPLPDVLTELQDRTRLTRRSVYRILTDSHRLGDFKRNPQAFIDRAAQAINRCKRQAVVDGIKYQRLGDDHYYAQELFENEELTGYLKNMRAATKSVYEEVVYKSDVEARFADQLEKNAAVKVYAKLPGWRSRSWIWSDSPGYHLQRRRMRNPASSALATPRRSIRSRTSIRPDQLSSGAPRCSSTTTGGLE